MEDSFSAEAQTLPKPVEVARKGFVSFDEFRAVLREGTEV